MTTTIAYTDVAGLAGTDLGYTDWLEITQEQVNTFADATGDHQWIHVDPERAKDGPFGAPDRPRVPHPVARRHLLDRAARGRGRDHEGQLRPRQGALHLAGQGRRARAHERGRRRGHRGRGRLPARRSTRPSRSRAPPSPPSSPAGCTASTPRPHTPGCRCGGIPAPPPHLDEEITDAQPRTRRLDGQAAPEDRPTRPALDPWRWRDGHLSAARRRHRPRLGAAVASGRAQGRPRRVPGREQPRVPRRCSSERRSSAPCSCRSTRGSRRPRSPMCSPTRGARVLIHDPEFAERVAAGVAQAGVPHVIATGEGARRARTVLLAAASGGHADADVTLDDPAAILYTSGTTGKAEGRRAHAREPHVGRAQLPRRLRRRLDRRRPHDLAALPRRLARHGRAAGDPQGRHDRAREGLRARARARAHRAARRHDAERRAHDVPAAGRPPALGEHRPQHAAEAHLRRARRCPPASSTPTRSAVCRSRRGTA